MFPGISDDFRDRQGTEAVVPMPLCTQWTQRQASESQVPMEKIYAGYIGISYSIMGV